MDPKLTLILEGAIKLFKQYGIRSISMDEIARSIGISKKTLYQYVENKEDLIEKVISYVIDKNTFDEIANSQNLNAIDLLLEISRMIMEVTREMNPVVVFDLHKFYPTLYRMMFVKKRDLIYTDICKNFEQGIRENLYRNDIDVDLVARLYVQRLMDIHDPEFISASFSRIFNVMFDSHIRSIVNQQGLTYYEEKIKPHVYD